MQLLDIPGIGEKIKETLERFGVTTPDQLLAYYPRTHRHYHRTLIKESEVGSWVMLTATLTRPVSRHTGRISTQISTATDQSGTLTLRWFNSPFITRSVKENTAYQILGKVETYAGRKHIVNPTLKIIDSDTNLPATLILPIYTPLGTLKSGNLRNIIKSALEVVKQSDPLEAAILIANHLLPKQDAIKNIHFPENDNSLAQAIHRLGFDELVSLQYEAITLKEHMSPETSALVGDHPSFKEWLKTIPFTLTSSQQNAIDQITNDLSQPHAMHRLITGDVGSGKTVVAAAASIWTTLSNKRVLMLAPTQILAEQLATTIKKFVGESITVSLYTRTTKESLSADIIVGTHALLSPKHKFENIGLVIIDEQHRFGVKDRETLRTLNPTPHLLMMSATPIPRTLAMTTLAHLDVSTMPDMPKNRLPVKSYVLNQAKRDDAYHWIKTEIETNNQQAFIVTPLIEQADNEEESPKTALLSLENELRDKFSNLKIDYVHGKMKSEEKTKHLEDFRAKKTQLLVATSMIEVGIDVPSVNIILIENAELFGLATLHQLRGRVGRGGGQGHCLLITNKHDQKTQDRLGFFVREKNGATLAEYDLKTRGPGDIFGTLQSGGLTLRFGNLADPALIAATQTVARSLAKKPANP